MKTPTDLVCQNFLASHHERIENCGNGIFRWKDAANEIIDETSWLQITQDVEAKLNQAQKVDYVNGIRLRSKDKMSDFDCMNLGWKQRAIALAKVMGRELAE